LPRISNGVKIQVPQPVLDIFAPLESI
jgi:hypothetical protein